jgi:hypothetical protein
VVQGVEEVSYGDRDVAARSMARRATERCPGLAGNRRWSSTEAQASSVCVGFDDLKHGSAEKLVREMRMIKTEGMVQEGEVGGILLHRNGRSSPAAVACSGEKLFGPGSVIEGGKKGEEERRGRPSYSRGLMANYLREIKGGVYSGEVPLPVRSNGRRLKRNLTGGAHLSVVKEK